VSLRLNVKVRNPYAKNSLEYNSRHAELVSRGKEQLVLIRPYKNRLVLHTMYYADEGRVFSQVPKAESVKV
jgi:non-homologous end joining protein Ku